MSMKFNSDLVKEESNNIKKEKDNLKTICEELNDRMIFLNDYWESNTRDEVYASFAEFKEHFENLIKLFENDIKFLDGTVSDYETMEQNANKEINDKIAG